MKIKNYVLLAVALIATAVPQASQCSFDWKKIGIGAVATVGALGAAYLFYKYVLAKPEQPKKSKRIMVVIDLYKVAALRQRKKSTHWKWALGFHFDPGTTVATLKEELVKETGIPAKIQRIYDQLSGTVLHDNVSLNNSHKKLQLDIADIPLVRLVEGEISPFNVSFEQPNIDAKRVYVSLTIDKTFFSEQVLVAEPNNIDFIVWKNDDDPTVAVKLP